ncbi:hypothetical protein LL06_18615, partial [Hoeflea sp. BAL378]
RRHPVVALWPAALAGALGEHLGVTEDLSMEAYLRNLPVAEADFACDEASDPFFNVNRPADLARAEALLAGPAAAGG